MKQGFTLLELLICLVIAGVLAMIAVPTWRDVTLRTQRSDATAALYALAAAQERYRLVHGRYADQAGPAPPAGLGFDRSERGWYLLRIESADQARFTASAQPVAGSRQATDAACQVLTIDESGQRGSTPAPVERCWR
ncbi:MAG: type IV pilin protein [Gammaproteobacteria bacterium]